MFASIWENHLFLPIWNSTKFVFICDLVLLVHFLDPFYLLELRLVQNASLRRSFLFSQRSQLSRNERLHFEFIIIYSSFLKFRLNLARVLEMLYRYKVRIAIYDQLARSFQVKGKPRRRERVLRSHLNF